MIKSSINFKDLTYLQERRNSNMNMSMLIKDQPSNNKIFDKDERSPIQKIKEN